MILTALTAAASGLLIWQAVQLEKARKENTGLRAIIKNLDDALGEANKGSTELIRIAEAWKQAAQMQRPKIGKN
jgi:hypothetical protein